MKQRFSIEQKKRIVREYENNHSVKDLCHKYGIAKSLLYVWVKKFKVITRPCAKERTFTAEDFYLLERKCYTFKEQLQILKESGCLKKLNTKEKVEIIDRLKDRYSFNQICSALNFSRGNYYKALKRKDNPIKTTYELHNEKMYPLIKQIFEDSKQRFGADRIRLMLMSMGYTASKKYILQYMKQENMVCKQNSPSYFNTCTNLKNHRFRKDKVKRNFTQEAPNMVWVSDITFIRVGKPFYALGVIIDLFSRKVIAYKISKNADTKLITELFLDAYNARNKPSGFIFHSDQGVQYTAYAFRKLLRDLNIRQSFSHPGTPYDNAVAESFFSVLKREEISHNYYMTQEELQEVVSEYIEFYNTKRPHFKLGAVTPNAYEEKYYKEREEMFCIKNKDL